MPTFNRPPVPPASSAPVLTGLGQALRWLRERQVRKQYRVASDAGITKGMLSAYETGRQRPSLETLDKLLETLGSDLNDLHNALQIVNGRPELMKGWRDTTPGTGAWDEAWPSYQRPAPYQQAQSSRGVPLADEVHERTGTDPRGHPGAGRPTDYASFPDLAGTAGLENRAAAAAFPPASPRHPLRQPEPPEGWRSSALAAYGPAGGSVAGAAGGAHPAGAYPAGAAGGGNRELYQVLAGGDFEHGPDHLPLAPLPPEEELALAQMLDGFHNLLRYWHSCLATLAALAAAGGLGGAPAPATLPGSAPTAAGARREQGQPVATAAGARRDQARPVATAAAVGETGEPGNAAAAAAAASQGAAREDPGVAPASLVPPAPPAPPVPDSMRPPGIPRAHDSRAAAPAGDAGGARPDPRPGKAKPGRRDHGDEGR